MADKVTRYVCHVHFTDIFEETGHDARDYEVRAIPHQLFSCDAILRNIAECELTEWKYISIHCDRAAYYRVRVPDEAPKRQGEETDGQEGQEVGDSPLFSLPVR